MAIISLQRASITMLIALNPAVKDRDSAPQKCLLWVWTLEQPPTTMADLVLQQTFAHCPRSGDSEEYIYAITAMPSPYYR